MRFAVKIAVFLQLASVGLVFGQNAKPFDLKAIRESRKDPIVVKRFDAPPVIDGNLDEPQWQTAAKFTDFVQTEPGDKVAPSRETIAYLGYDTENLYIAFMCFDEPDKISYSIAKRDQVGGEDYVGVFFDTFNDQRKAYIFQFNPLGIQADGIKTASDSRSDFSVDIVMESKGVIRPNGYSIEVKIPFKSLRYASGDGKMWGIDFWRRISRFNREIAGWMPMERGVSEIQQLGKITGLKGIRTERTLEIVPSITVSKAAERVEDPGSPNNSVYRSLPLGKDLGVSVKFQITPNITLDAAVNPDFAEIEADAPVVRANERFPIFFAEKRPFFLEGIDIFRSQLQAVNTRNIADPDVALKLTGKIGKNTFGILGAVDNFEETKQKAFAGVLRLKRDIGENSDVGMFLTQYHLGATQHNSLGGFDGNFQLDSRTKASFEVFGSYSRRYFYDPDVDDSVYRSGTGIAYRAEYDYTGRNRGMVIGVTGRSRDYRADLGFTRRTNTHGGNFGYRLQTEPKPNAAIIRLTHRGSANLNFDESGRMQHVEYGAFNSIDFQNQLEFSLRGSVGKEWIYEDEFGARRSSQPVGAFSGLPSRSALQFSASSQLQKNFNNKLRLSGEIAFTKNRFDFDFGASERYARVSPAYLQYLIDRINNPNLEEPPIDPGKGFSWGYELELEVQPTDPLNIRFVYERTKLTRNDNGLTAFDSNLFSLRSTYQFTRFMFSRTRFDYDTVEGALSSQLLFGWAPNPGTAFFVGYNDSSYYRGYNYFNNSFDNAFRRDSGTFYIRASYLFRKSF